jgi:phosphoglycolate phosphatase
MAFPRAVIFDYDGTLVDSAPDIADALNAAFKPHSSAGFGRDDVISLVGGGAAVALECARERLGLTLDEPQKLDLRQRFLAHYADVSRAGRGVYPGVVDVLRTLRRQGVLLAVCTNKVQSVTDIAVAAVGLADHLDIVLGQSDAMRKKPAPDMLWHIAGRLGVAPGEAVMIGDSLADVGAARAAPMPVIVSASGYSAVPAHDLGADAVYHHALEIPALLSQVWRSGP